MSGKAEKRIGKHGTTWQFTLELPRDPATGKRRQKLLTARTKREVEEKATQYYASIATGGFAEADASKLTVAKYLARWLEYVEKNGRQSTHQRYSDLIRLHIMPLIGNVQLSRLTPLHVQDLYSNRLAMGKATATVELIHCVLHRALKQAVRWGLLIRNVTELVDAPTRVTPEYTTWNEHQAAMFLQMADGHQFAALWRLALLTGLRRGELLGLKWADLDLAQGKLTVKRSLSRGRGGSYTFGAPKTAQGKRTLDIQRSVVASLQSHRKRQLEARLKFGEEYRADLDIVFADAIGEPLHPNTLTYQFKRLCIKAGVPSIRIHDLRHSAATLMIAQGISPDVVQKRLGHSDVALTLRIYTHASPQVQRDAADRLEALIEGAL
jgi:integrase